MSGRAPPRRSRRRSRGRRSPACSSGRSRAARPRPHRADLWLVVPRRGDVLDRGLRPRCGAVGRRHPVEVPRRRLGRPLGGARRGAVATQAYANPRYGPDGLALLRAGSRAAEVIDRLPTPTTTASTASSAWSTRTAAARASPARSASTGPGLDRALLRRAGQHSRRRRDGRRRSPPRSGHPRPAAGAAAARVPRGRAGRRGRPARPAIGLASRRRARRRLRAALRRPRRPAGRRPRAAGRRARAACTASIHCSSARHRARSGSRSTAGCAPSSFNDSHALGYDGELEQAFDAWAGIENLEERVDGVRRIDPVVLAELRAR